MTIEHISQAGRIAVVKSPEPTPSDRDFRQKAVVPD